MMGQAVSRDRFLQTPASTSFPIGWVTIVLVTSGTRDIRTSSVLVWVSAIQREPNIFFAPRAMETALSERPPSSPRPARREQWASATSTEMENSTLPQLERIPTAELGLSPSF